MTDVQNGVLDPQDGSRVWHWSEEQPRPNSRIVMLYEDGSGAFLGFWTGETLFDPDGDDYGWRDEPGAMWAYLPAGFDLWCENRADDPMTFPASDTPNPHGQGQSPGEGVRLDAAARALYQAYEETTDQHVADIFAWAVCHPDNEVRESCAQTVAEMREWAAKVLAAADAALQPNKEMGRG